MKIQTWIQWSPPSTQQWLKQPVRSLANIFRRKTPGSLQKFLICATKGENWERKDSNVKDLRSSRKWTTTSRGAWKRQKKLDMSVARLKKLWGRTTVRGHSNFWKTWNEGKLHKHLKASQQTQKGYYEKTTRDLPPLHSGQQIQMQGNRGTWTPAMVIEKRPDPCSYTIHTPLVASTTGTNANFETCQLNTPHGQMRRPVSLPTIPHVSNNRWANQQYRQWKRPLPGWWPGQRQAHYTITYMMFKQTDQIINQIDWNYVSDSKYLSRIEENERTCMKKRRGSWRVYDTHTLTYTTVNILTYDLYS